jgi:hypothetical protein
MDDDGAEVDQYPFARLLALDAVGARAERPHFFLQVSGQGPPVPVRVGADDDHRVEQRRHPLHVQHQNIAPLDVLQRRHRRLRQLV